MAVMQDIAAICDPTPVLLSHDLHANSAGAQVIEILHMSLRTGRGLISLTTSLAHLNSHKLSGSS